MNWRRVIVLILVGALLFFITACASIQAKSTPPPKRKPTIAEMRDHWVKNYRPNKYLWLSDRWRTREVTKI